MRRALSALAVLGVSGVLVLGGAGPASAVDPVPGPVDEILDIPSRVVRSVTGSPLGDSVVMMMLKGQRWVAGGGALVPVSVANTPKPITAPAAISRVGGTALTAIIAGWAIASNGTIAIIGATTGNGYEQTFCSQPDWYQATTGFVNMGFAPECTAKVPEPNFELPTTYGGVSYSGYSLTVLRVSPYVDAGSNGVLCVATSGALPAGYGLYGTRSDGVRAGQLLNLNPYGPACGSDKIIGIPKAGYTGAPAYIAATASPTVPVATQSAGRGDPQRQLKCRIDWEDGTTTTGNGSTYRESTGVPLSASGTGCEQAYVSKPGRGPALLPDRISVDSQVDGGAITEISEQAVPDFSPTERKAFGPSNGRGLVLEKIVGVDAGSCMTWAADCSEWWEQTDEGTTTGTYRCTFGGEVIPLVECGPYRHTFDEMTDTPTITNPATGAEEGWSSQPNTSNSINPGAGPGTGSTPSDKCFANGWAAVANPLDWVLVPVKCALVWAFVPRASEVEAAQGRIEAARDETIVGTVGTALAGLGAAFDAGVGCGGLPVHIEGFGVTLVHAQLLASCEEPAAGIAATVRTVLTIAIIIGGILAMIRYLGALFGFQGFGKNRSEPSGVSFD